MKIKPLKQLILILTICGLLTSCQDSSTPTRAELNKAINTLNKFGEKIATGNLSKDDKELIKDLSDRPIPIFKFINKNTILAAGIDFKSKKDVVFDTITGKTINPCNRLISADQKGAKLAVKQKCKTQIIAPNETIKAILSMTKPIKGEIKVNGVLTPAEYSVSTTVSYKGSYCITRIQAGKQVETCYSY